MPVLGDGKEASVPKAEMVGEGSGRKWVLGGSIIGVTGLVVTPGKVGIRMRGVT